MGYGQWYSLWFGIKGGWKKNDLLLPLEVHCACFESIILVATAWSCLSLLPCLGFSAFSAPITVWSVTVSCVESSHVHQRPGIPGKFHNIASDARRDQTCGHTAAATELAALEIFWLLCDFMDRPVSSKARLLFLKTKLQLFVCACCSESWAGYKTLLSKSPLITNGTARVNEKNSWS